MGVLSTRFITRADAIRAIEARIRLASKDDLACLLYALFSDATMNNYIVVDDHPEGLDVDWADVDRLLEMGDERSS